MNSFVLSFFSVIFVTAAFAQINVGGGLQSACALATPVRCPNSVCVTDISLCPVNNCTGLTPYRCSDSTCAISAIYCNGLGVICSDGSCKPNMTVCPILDGCPELTPQRCPDGSCAPYNSNCSQNTGTHCPDDLQLCIDGICRISSLCQVLPYNGCPHFECSDGTCTSNYTDCLCPSDPTKVRCHDLSCVPLGTLCAFPAPAFVHPMNLTVTINTTLPTVIGVPSSSNLTKNIVTLSVPGGAVSGYSNSSLNTIAVGGVSNGLLTNSTIADPLGNLTTANVVSSAVSVSFGSGQSVMNSPVGLYFHDVSSADSNVCVAVLEPNGTWSCVADSTVSTDSSGLMSVSANVSHFSTYAVVKKPVCFPSGREAASAYCARQTWSGATGYFCADNGHHFYECVGGAWGGFYMACGLGTSCNCCDGSECSQGGLVSPCR